MSLTALVEELLVCARALTAFAIDRDGQLLAAAGDADDRVTVTLASTTARDLASPGVVEILLGDGELVTELREGAVGAILLRIVGGCALLTVIFDHGSSVALVRDAVSEACPRIDALLERTGLEPITDDDLRALLLE